MSVQLLPCPFCGAGATTVEEGHKVWTGIKYGAPLTYSVRHFCEKLEGDKFDNMIVKKAKTMKEAIALWNRRMND